MKELLPLGTVFRLGDSISLVMVMGYYPVNEEKKIYRYLTVTYPFGLYKDGSVAMMNPDAVEEILFTGYSSEEAGEYRKRIQMFMDLYQQRNQKKALHAEKKPDIEKQ